MKTRIDPERQQLADKLTAAGKLPADWRILTMSDMRVRARIHAEPFASTAPAEFDPLRDYKHV